MNVALCPEHLDVLSLCTGGGGLDLGVELAVPGARTVCVVEREAFAVAQLVSAMEAGLMAPAPVWSDARTFDGRRWRGCVDAVIGGIPCQPHSLAGKRLGEEDERDLWSDARRIIVQSGAWFVLIENVRGMLSAKDGLDPGAFRVWRDLQRLGFDVEGGLFTAAEVGASHERERFFILGVADDAQRRWSAGVAGQCDEPSWQDRRRGVHVSGVDQADAYSERLERLGSDDRTVGRKDARRQAGLRDRAALVDTESVGRGEGRPEPEFRSGRDAIAGTGAAMGNASIARGRRIPVQQGRQVEAYPDIDRASHDPRRALDYASRSRDERILGDEASSQRAASGRELIVQPDERRGWPDDIDAGRGISLFPPGPGDIDGWRAVLERAPELEPAFRRVADGLASGVDLAQCWSRVDRLRELGNGVVSLAAAYALRTLATRLAGRGSAGAARLVRMMEITA